jgi:TonB-like protein
MLSSRPVRRWHLRCAVVLLGFLHPGSASAQSEQFMFSDSTSALFSERNLPVTWRTAAPACLAAASSLPLYRAPVFLSYGTNDTHNHLQLSQAGVIAADVVREIRKELRAAGDSDADGSSRVSWRALPVRLQITAVGDGPITGVLRGPPSDSSASSLVANAFERARRAGTALMPWRNKAGGEPVVISLWLYAPAVDSAGHWKHEDPDDTRLTAFWIPLPAHSYATVFSLAKLQYPKKNQKAGVEGDVTLRFVVDSSGRAQPATIYDISPAEDANAPRLSAEDYVEFRDASREWVLNSVYSPEKLGGCVIESVLDQPVKFRFRQ